MASTQMTKALLSDMLLFNKTAGATGTDPKLFDAKCGLFVNDIVLSASTLLAQLTPCSITGYALSAALTWSGPTISNETGLPCIRAALLTFTMTTQTDPPQQIFGAYLVDNGATELLAAVKFSTPVTPQDGTVVQVVVRLGLQSVSIEPAGLLTLS